MIDEVVLGNPLSKPVAQGQTTTTPEMQAGFPARSEQADSPVEPGAVDRKELEKAVTKIQDSIGQLNSSLKIVIDPDLHRVVVKVINNQSGEVIRQIPSQETLEIAKGLDAMQGLLLTKRT